MNVSELLSLTNWITDNIITPGIVKKYQDLHTILSKNAQANQQQTPFSSQNTILTEALKNVPLCKLTKDQLLFLSDLEIADNVGPKGVEQLEDVLYKNSLDIATAAQKLSKIFNELNTGIQKSNQIKAGLNGCSFEEEYETDDEILMRVSFTGNAVMSNVIDFKKWGNTWFDIGRGVAMAHDEPPEAIKIVGATRGSVVLELVLAAKIVGTMSLIILPALKVVEKVLDIRKKAEELRGMKLKNKSIAKEIDDAAKEEKEAGVEKIIANTVKQIGLKENGDGERVTVLKKAIRSLVDFIQFGGEVDFIIPEDEPEDEANSTNPEYEKLRVAAKEIRQLESKLKLLPIPVFEDTPVESN